MRRLLNQMFQVVLVYMLRPRLWLWLAFLWLWGVLMASPFSCFFYGLWLATFMNEQMTVQFAHYRARLMPGFRRAHLAVPAIFCVVMLVVVPTLVAWANGSLVTQRLAIASTGFALAILIQHYSALSWIIFIGLFGPMLFGYSITEMQLDLPPVAYTGILLFSWILIVLHFAWYEGLREDKPSYKKALAQLVWDPRSGKVTTANRRDASPFNQFVRMLHVSDWWHDRIDGYHGYRRPRIIHLLRYGFKENPAVLQAIGWGIAITAFLSFVLVRGVDWGDEVDFPSSAWAYIAFFATLIPSAQAGADLGERRRFLATELLLPLSRQQLIDGLFLASAWNAALSWLCSNGALTFMLLFLPGKTTTVLFVLTYLLLSASMGALMFALALFDVKLASRVERIVGLLFVVAICAFVFVFWWMSRKAAGDIPFWIVAIVLFVISGMLISSARETWSGLEFGNTQWAKNR
jgi:hypothetical protein